MSTPFSAGSLYSSHEQSQVWSQSCSTKSHSQNLLSDATRQSCLFPYKNANWLSIFLYPIYSYSQVNKELAIIVGEVGYCWIKGSVRRLY